MSLNFLKKKLGQGKKETKTPYDLLPFESSLTKSKKGKVVKVQVDFEAACKQLGPIDMNVDLQNKKTCKTMSFDGGTYQGQMQNKQFHGLGAYQLVNGDFYLGSFKNGLKSGLGLYKLGSEENESFYKGFFVRDKKEGPGCMKMHNGDCYIGLFKDETFNGKGKLIFASGDYYEGDFKDGRMNGLGMYIYQQKQQYEGEFKAGKKDGYGVLLSLIDNSKYQGMFQRDSREGEGHLFIEGVLEYTGKFVDNKKNGHGKMTDLINQQMYEGIFLNGQKHGPGGKLRILGKCPYDIYGTFDHDQLLYGETILPDGSHYKGEFKELKPHGKGHLSYGNGNEYRGQLEAGMKQGQGRYFDNQDKSLYEGEFKHDKFNGKGRFTFSDGSSFLAVFIDNVLDYKIQDHI